MGFRRHGGLKHDLATLSNRSPSLVVSTTVIEVNAVPRNWPAPTESAATNTLDIKACRSLIRHLFLTFFSAITGPVAVQGLRQIKGFSHLGTAGRCYGLSARFRPAYSASQIIRPRLRTTCRGCGHYSTRRLHPSKHPTRTLHL